ncbi:MAG: hypothetical protein MUE88_08280 [Flavobacteriales bacterium]|jgi:hypothetical protein|nr:hypothetical protein [Flavobacteriales bacterium]
MGSPLGSLLKSLVPFSLLCIAAHVLLMQQWSLPFTKAHWVPPVFFSLLSLVLLAWQEAAGRTDPKTAVRRFMTGMVLKMFGSLTLVLVVVLMLPKPERLAFAMAFMGYYLAHLAFAAVRMTRAVGGPASKA